MKNKKNISMIETVIWIMIFGMASAMPLSAQPRCFVYVDDFGSEQDNRIRSLGKEIQAQQSELRLMEKMTKIDKYDRDVILARAHRKMAIFQLQSEKQLLDNKCFKDRYGPKSSFR
jgi:hypothetical protein